MFSSGFVVVGVVDDVRMPGRQFLSRGYQVYQPPRPGGGLLSVVARTPLPSNELLGAVKRAITSVQPTPFIQTWTVGDVFLRNAFAPTRFAMALLGAFAVVALTLAAVGLYGVIAYSVTQRTREIGVRVALGARPREVTRLVVGGGLRLALGGALLGIAGAALSTRLLGAMLFGVDPMDPATFAAIATLVVAIAVLASYVPARRALRIDPIEALRTD